MNDESQNIEYKRTWSDEYLKWVCGFANAQGGKIFIGVDDGKTIFGLADSHRQMEEFLTRLSHFSELWWMLICTKKTAKNIWNSL